MSRGQKASQSAPPSPPTVVIPGITAAAALAVCWLTGDQTVLRAAGTVVAVAALVALWRMSRYLHSTLGEVTLELRARNRDVSRLREVTNQMLEQLGTQRDQMAQLREDANDVREEAAALLEVVESRLGGPVSGDLASSFTRFPPSAFPGPITGPVATPAPPSPPLSMPAPPAEAPSAPSSPQPPPPPAERSERQPGRVGYLESFSLDEDEPLTEYWSRSGSADEEDSGSDNGEAPPDRWW
ncbi:MAG: hypothetical protein ACRDYU_03275 [Actinomycetes bacterium]